MVSLVVYDRAGKEVGTMDVDPAVFAPTINRQLLHDVVVMYQANQRQGTFRTKSRGMVAGTGKKMYRQKGTGNARAGSKQSGVRRGGGHIFRKDPRDFSYRLPRKAVQLATRMAIAAKLQSNQVTVVEDLHFDKPRTREMAAILRAVHCADQSLLVGLAQHDENVYLSTRNIDKVEITPVRDLNAWSILRPARLLLTKSALEQLTQQAAATPKSRSQMAAAAG
ncbi:MAG: 50S ribosomal protein L4 [Pirellulales bacterium]|nr:50S ribosomal protein L4 [Pirellulales bacterium]